MWTFINMHQQTWSWDFKMFIFIAICHLNQLFYLKISRTRGLRMLIRFWKARRTKKSWGEQKILTSYSEKRDRTDVLQWEFKITIALDKVYKEIHMINKYKVTLFKLKNGHMTISISIYDKGSVRFVAWRVL